MSKIEFKKNWVIIVDEDTHYITITENVYNRKKELMYLIEKTFKQLYNEEIEEIKKQACIIEIQKDKIKELERKIEKEYTNWKNNEELEKLRKLALFSIWFFMIWLVVNFILFFVYYV